MDSLLVVRTIVNYAAGTLGTPNTGYFAGGGSPNKSTVERIDYSNDTATASVRGNLVQISIYAQGVSNSTHGYVTGGEGTSPSAISQVQRITYLNDTVLSLFKGNLSQTKSAYDAVGTENFGYIAGPGVNIDKIDYSNDSATATPKGDLSNLGFDCAAAGNKNFGLFCWWLSGKNNSKSS